MKVWLDKDEKYPDLILRKECDNYSFEMELSDELAKEYEESLDRLTQAENKIFALWDEQKKVNSCK